jgi:hypothetical protein
MRHLRYAGVGIALLAQLFLSLSAAPTKAAQKPTVTQDMPTGNELLEDCKQALRVIDGDTTLTDKEWVDGSHCTGYILGVVDGYAETEAAEKARLHFSSSLICFPKEGFLGTPQVVRLVVKYLRDNPKNLHDHAALLILLAFQEVFPCNQ